MRRGADRLHACLNALHGRDPGLQNMTACFCIQIFRQGAANCGRYAGCLASRNEAVAVSAIVGFALVKSGRWIILYQNGTVIPIFQKTFKDRQCPFIIAPDWRSIIKWIGHRGGVGQKLGECGGGVAGRLDKIKFKRCRVICQHCGAASRTGESSNFLASWHTGNGQKFQ